MNRRERFSSDSVGRIIGGAVIIFSCLSFRSISAVGRLWSGQSQVGADQDVLERGRHPVVPSARRPARIYRVFDAHRHVVRN